MNIVYVALLFLLGAVTGSFFNVVLLRKNTGESIVWGSSRCFSCGKQLSTREMVPILSFWWQKGRCRHCGSKISRQYPIVEFLAGVLFVLVLIRAEDIVHGMVMLTAFALLFLLALYDARTKIIDTHIMLLFFFASVTGAALRWYEGRAAIGLDLISSLSLALFFYAMWFLSRGRWMGGGDWRVALATSLLVGFPFNIMAFLYAFWIGAIAGTGFLIFSHGRVSLKMEIPFAPFLALGTFLAWFFPYTLPFFY